MYTGQLDFLYKVDPNDIEREAFETDVFIPCINTETQLPIWEINGLLYDLFHLPGKILPAVHGILIQVVEENMNGTTFRCYTEDTSKSILSVRASSLGTLTVYEQIQSVAFNEVATSKTEFHTIRVDHEHTSFNDTHTTIAWIQYCNYSSSEYMTVNVHNCKNKTDHTWTITNPSVGHFTISANNLGEDDIITISAFDNEKNYCSMNESFSFHKHSKFISY